MKLATNCFVVCLLFCFVLVNSVVAQTVGSNNTTDWITILGFIIGVVGLPLAIIAFLVGLVDWLFPDSGPRLIVRLMPGPRYNWGTVPKNIVKAQRRVWVLQTWLPGLRLELPWWREALRRQNIEFRVLLLDQKLVPSRLRCREPVSSLLTQNVSDLTELSRQFNLVEGNPRIEVRFYSCIPFGPIYIVDDEIYWGLYLPDRDSMRGPVFHSLANSKLGQQILTSYEAVWRSASHTTGSLGVSPPQLLSRPPHTTEKANIERKTATIINVLSRRALKDVLPLDANIGCLCLLRHADTDLNTAAIVTGELDVGINADGRIKAREIGKHIRRECWNRVYSSPLRRCIETLTEALPDKIETVELRDELRERAMGDLEGYSRKSYFTSLPQYDGTDMLTSFHTAPNNGESYCDVFWRVLPLLEEVISLVMDGQRVLVCSHEGPIRMMLMALDGLTDEVAIKKVIHSGEFLYYLPTNTMKSAD